jgi:hypothetical protein
MDINEKLEKFRELVEFQQEERLLAFYTNPEHREAQAAHDSRTRIKMGRKYANVDVGSSGKYMVELATGAIYGIKAYGVIHRGHYYGTLDSIYEWNWSDYWPVKRKLETVAT